jgi:hypothetical protein
MQKRASIRLGFKVTDADLEVLEEKFDPCNIEITPIAEIGGEETDVVLVLFDPYMNDEFIFAGLYEAFGDERFYELMEVSTE